MADKEDKIQKALIAFMFARNKTDAWKRGDKGNYRHLLRDEQDAFRALQRLRPELGDHTVKIKGVTWIVPIKRWEKNDIVWPTPRRKDD